MHGHGRGGPGSGASGTGAGGRTAKQARDAANAAAAAAAAVASAAAAAASSPSATGGSTSSGGGGASASAAAALAASAATVAAAAAALSSASAGDRERELIKAAEEATWRVQQQLFRSKQKNSLASLVGYMPQRGDFETEYENEAELLVSDLEFRAEDSPWERALKLKVLEVYNSKLDARRERKDFIVSRGLLHRRERKRTRDEREVHQALRPLARFHSQADHDALVQGVLNERRLRQRIEQLQAYRVNGVRTLAEGVLFEAERARRELAIAGQREAVGLSAEPTSVRDALLMPYPRTAPAAPSAAAAAAVAAASSSAASAQQGGVVVMSDDSAAFVGATGAGSGSGSGAGAGSTVAPSAGAEIEAEGPPPVGAPLPPPTGLRAAKKARLAFTADGAVTGAGAGAANGGSGGSGSGSGGAGAGEGLVVLGDIEFSQAAGPAAGSLPLSAITGFDVSHMDGVDSLSPAERALCTELRLAPAHYIVVKERILRECVAHGFVARGQARQLLRIDVHSSDRIVDFFVSAGWVALDGTQHAGAIDAGI